MNLQTLPPLPHPLLFSSHCLSPLSSSSHSFPPVSPLLHPTPVFHLQTCLSVHLSTVLPQQSASFSPRTFCFAVWSLVYLQLSIRPPSVLRKPRVSLSKAPPALSLYLFVPPVRSCSPRRETGVCVCMCTYIPTYTQNERKTKTDEHKCK